MDDNEVDGASMSQIPTPDATSSEALRVLKEILPLAEAYLKSAPSDPRNTHLEDARALVRGHGIHYAKGIPLTYNERLALREAITFRLSGEYEDIDDAALRRAEKKL